VEVDEEKIRLSAEAFQDRVDLVER